MVLVVDDNSNCNYYLPTDTSIHGRNVKWKTFKDKNGIFTIKYPSNWSPIKPTTESPAPIDIYFFHAERGSFVTLTLYADESILSSNVDLMDSYLAYDQSEQNYRLIQPTECEKYMVNTIKVCSAIDTFRLTTVDSKPMITQLIMGGIDSEGVEYGVTYRATPDLFDDFLPVAEELIGSLNVTGNILNSGGESVKYVLNTTNLPFLFTSLPLKVVCSPV